MKKKLYLPIRIEEKKYETEIVWDINLADEPIEDWCLNLSLLNWDLIDSLSLTSDISPYKVYFSKSENVSAPERAIAKLEQNKFYLELSENELEY